MQKAVNEKCRKLTKRVAFYTVDCRGSCGEIFVDLQNYKYAKVLISFYSFDGCISHVFQFAYNVLTLQYIFFFYCQFSLHRKSLMKQWNVN